jgi:acyl-CoA thioesterase
MAHHDDTAREHVERMFAADVASRALGMQIVDVGAGRASVRMPITEQMVNGHGIGHGGYTFLVADSAFAFACNGDGVPNVAAACDIVFVTPTRAGDVLEATAVRRHQAGRNGIYDVTVRRVAAAGASLSGGSGTGDSGTDGSGTDAVVAEFRGIARAVRDAGSTDG